MKNYDTGAHSDNFHGKAGSATGSPRDTAPMDYSRKTHAEGARSMPVAGAPSEMPSAGAAHKFEKHPATGAHGFGHPAHVRSGHLRGSGHKNAHRVGKR